MAFPIGDVFAGLSGLSSVAGLFGASSARKRAEAARQKLITEIGFDLDNELARRKEAASRGLYSLGGTLTDSLGKMGRGLGSRLAEAGVFNSSATAGALAQAEADKAATMADYAARSDDSLNEMAGANKRYLSGLKMGSVNDSLGRADAAYGNALGGFQSFLGNLAQFNLSKLGVPNANSTGPAGYGKANSKLPKFGTGFGPGSFSSGSTLWGGR